MVSAQQSLEGIGADHRALRRVRVDEHGHLDSAAAQPVGDLIVLAFEDAYGHPRELGEPPG